MVARLRNFRNYVLPSSNPEFRLISADWKAPKGYVYVAVVLGTELEDGSDPLPIVDFLRALVIDGQPVLSPAEETAP